MRLLIPWLQIRCASDPPLGPGQGGRGRSERTTILAAGQGGLWAGVVVGMLAGCSALPPANPLASAAPSPVVIDPDGSTWYAYIAPDGSYSLKFPAAPTESVGQRGVAWVDRGDHIYWASGETIHAGLPADDNPETEVQAYLDAVTQGVLRQFGGQQLDYTERLVISGQPGRRLAFRNDRGFQFEVRLAFDPVRSRLLSLAFGTTGDNLALPEAQAFFNSFRLLDPVPLSSPP